MFPVPVLECPCPTYFSVFPALVPITSSPNQPINSFLILSGCVRAGATLKCTPGLGASVLLKIRLCCSTCVFHAAVLLHLLSMPLSLSNLHLTDSARARLVFVKETDNVPLVWKVRRALSGVRLQGEEMDLCVFRNTRDDTLGGNPNKVTTVLAMISIQTSG